MRDVRDSGCARAFAGAGALRRLTRFHDAAGRLSSKTRQRRNKVTGCLNNYTRLENINPFRGTLDIPYGNAAFVFRTVSLFLVVCRIANVYAERR